MPLGILLMNRSQYKKKKKKKSITEYRGSKLIGFFIFSSSMCVVLSLSVHRPTDDNEPFSCTTVDKVCLGNTRRRQKRTLTHIRAHKQPTINFAENLVLNEANISTRENLAQDKSRRRIVVAVAYFPSK